MITHIVLCRLRADTPDDRLAAVWADLEALRDVVPGMTGARFGANVSPEGLARGHTHAFVMTFESSATRDAYLEHPAHKDAGAALVSICEGGLDGLTVVDI